MALFILNEEYGYDKVTAFLESLEYDVEQATLSEAGGSRSRLFDRVKKSTERGINSDNYKYNKSVKGLEYKQERELYKNVKQRAAVVTKADQDYNAKLLQNEAELKKVIESKPRSWVEKKLMQFKAALHRFKNKYGTSKDGQSKTILQKIISTLTRIITWITDKVLKGARFINDKLGGSKKADEFKSKFTAAKVDKHIADYKALNDRNRTVNEYDRTQAARQNAKKGLYVGKIADLKARYNQK